MTSYEWESPGATALVVPFPQAEPLIGRLRRQHTPSGAEGMVAHATLLAPFVHASELGQNRTAAIARALEPFRAFEVRLASFARFVHIGVLYLAPDPPEPFVAMSEALLKAFPEVEYPPEGATEIVPHVTVASRLTADELDRIEEELTPGLPIAVVADRVVLAERGEDGRWRDRAEFVLPWA